MFESMNIENNFPRISLDFQRSSAPRLPHEVRVCNHLMLCSFGQQNQDMIIRGLNVFFSGNRGGVDEWNRIGAPKIPLVSNKNPE